MIVNAHKKRFLVVFIYIIIIKPTLLRIFGILRCIC